MDRLEPFLVDDYYLEKPYSYMFLEEFAAKSHLAHHYWQADGLRWSCCDEKGRIRFLNDGKKFVAFLYENDLLQCRRTYYQDELAYEELYFYNSFHSLESSYTLVKGVKKGFKNYFYNSQEQLIRSQQEKYAINYGYNDHAENTRRDFYENERLQESWKDTFESGKLRQREEFYANKQHKCRHLYFYDQEERLQQYKLVSGQKLLLLHLCFRYPVLINQAVSQQKTKKNIWLEREIYRQFDHRSKGVYQLPLHLSRRAFTSFENLKSSAEFKIEGRRFAIPQTDKTL